MKKPFECYLMDSMTCTERQRSCQPDIYFGALHVQKTQSFGHWIMSPSSVKDLPEDGDRIQSSQTFCFKYVTGRWIMSRNTIIVLIYHRHKLLGIMCRKDQSSKILLLIFIILLRNSMSDREVYYFIIFSVNLN
jgi:hypothetical protein